MILGDIISATSNAIAINEKKKYIDLKKLIFFAFEGYDFNLFLNVFVSEIQRT